MENNQQFNRALEHSLIVRFPKQRLATFGSTNIKYYVVGVTGIDPVTPAVSRQCSTAELHTHI